MICPDRWHRAVIAAAAASLVAVPAGAGQVAGPSVPAGSPLVSAPAPAPAPVQAPMLLPGHSGDPMRISAASDPLLALARRVAPVEQFRGFVVRTIDRAPAAREAEANSDEAAAALDEARAAKRPTLDLSLNSYKVLGRNFGNNAENVIERARPGRRTDFIVTADQLLLGGGAGNRIGAASERLRAATADIETTADRVALDTVAAWYDVFTFRALVQLGEAFDVSQRELRGMVQERIARGVSAEADLARVDSYIASADTRLARFRRLRMQAEARFEALTGSSAPAGLSRAPFAGPIAISRDLAVLKSVEVPSVRAARFGAEAARRDAKAARADTLPTLSAGIDAGRYGIYETPQDYDVRARVTIRQRLFGGIDARADQARARAASADARADRIGEDAARDAEIAWTDVAALQEQLRAIEASYIASRQSRDTIAERFRLTSGTVFDVIGAEANYFDTATGYLQSVTELDAARYVLLSRTGMLLEALGIAPPPPRMTP